MYTRMIRDYIAYSEVPFGLIERVETPEGETLCEGPLDMYTACSRVENDIKAKAVL